MLVGARTAAWSGGGLSAKSYVQSGLIAMWDGIENAGWGTHDASATTWKELISDSMPLQLVSGYSWDSDALVAETTFTFHQGTSYSYPLGSASTIEIVQHNDIAGSSTKLIVRIQNDNDLYFEALNLEDKERVYFGGASKTLSGQIKHNFSAVIDGTAYKVFENGSQLYTGSFTPSASASNLIYFLCWCGSWKYQGRLSAVRLYSRALTAAEIAANYAVDRERFNLP